MSPEDFNSFVREKGLECLKTMVWKADEYAPKDRFANFRKAALLNGCTPETALWGMVSKHIIALADYVQTVELGGEIPMECWDEKLGDVINYSMLLWGLAQERESFRKILVEQGIVGERGEFGPRGHLDPIGVAGPEDDPTDLPPWQELDLRHAVCAADRINTIAKREEDEEKRVKAYKDFWKMEERD